MTEDWYFLSHRLPMAREARRVGYDVHVVTRVNKGGAAIEAEGFRLHSVVWQRGSINPFAFFSNIRAVRRHYRAIQPDIVHHVALQPTIVGSLAAAGLSSMRLNALAGLGFSFASSTSKARLVRLIFARCCGTFSAIRARRCWCKTPTTARRCAALGSATIAFS